MEGQLNISNFGDTLEVRLRNFPDPYETKMQGGHPVSKWNHPDKSELQDEPPVYKEQKESSQDVTLIKREDNDAVCGFDIKDWKEHRDIMHLRKEEPVCNCGENEACHKCSEVKVSDWTKLDAPRM